MLIVFAFVWFVSSFHHSITDRKQKVSSIMGSCLEITHDFIMALKYVCMEGWAYLNL